MNNRGFTLLEIVIAILTILIFATLGFKIYGRDVKRGYNSSIVNVVSSLSQAIVLYNRDTNQYPHTLEDLVQNSGIDGWAGPYTNYKIDGNQLLLAGGRIKISYDDSVSGNTDCGYLENRPALIVEDYRYEAPHIEGLCLMKSGNDYYYLIP